MKYIHKIVLQLTGRLGRLQLNDKLWFFFFLILRNVYVEKLREKKTG